ncbi:hypothetical protein [Burkholderia cenocepacia]|uniref:hypothetical protein n=1 Tax=Burkholderia cenocepacia TaxID=95486 RepID=UPI00075965E2|nr:hypothetical protein [Burkholderia cenocepacia]AOK33936.1 hypothetical protein WL90_06525 [Burkholderia cenocepacia]KWF74573.1 hypothetical protein WL89_30955 [Burkholderia cenocepacia]
MDTNLTITAERVDRVVNASLKVMADFATRATPYATFTEKEILAAVLVDPTGDVALFLARLIAKSIETVAALDYIASA